MGFIKLNMKIQILIDNKNSWFIPYGKNLKDELSNMGHEVYLCHEHEDVKDGEILFILSCEKILKETTLKKNKHNLVIHGSNLPEGRGMSPLTWEVLSGRSKFYVSLLEATKQVDAGKIYMKSSFLLEGHELNEEIKDIQSKNIINLAVEFVRKFPDINPEEQVGDATYYKRRVKEDSEIDINRSINDQFNLLRIVDNERYPAFFIRDGKKYILKIYKEN